MTLAQEEPARHNRNEKPRGEYREKALGRGRRAQRKLSEEMGTKNRRREQPKRTENSPRIMGLRGKCWEENGILLASGCGRKTWGKSKSEKKASIEIQKLNKERVTIIKNKLENASSTKGKS